MSPEAPAWTLYRWVWGFIAALVLAVAVYAVLVWWSGAGEFAEVFGSIPITTLLAAAGLATGNFAVRFLRWHWLLGRLSAKLAPGRSLWIFLSGLAFTITPGKAGEAVKSVFCARLGVPVRTTLAVVWMERFYDLVSVIVLFSLGMVFLTDSLLWAAVPMWITTALLLWLVYAASGRALLLRLFPRWRDGISAWLAELDRVRSWHVAALTLLISALGWLLEGIAFWLILDALSIPAGVAFAQAVYFAGTLAGVFFPGGLGGTEGMMTLLLAGTAGAARVGVAVLAIRLVTLWWATLLGLGCVVTLIADTGRQARPKKEIE
ncbi:flippase-like domain-containing protein [Myxococcota bacterium]|nr:flippase-like domain-containing protein [Myxococcota bacterium]MBU1510640.1 flippase-like domain-containing protein [Myxococcota bacterium]